MTVPETSSHLDLARFPLLAGWQVVASAVRGFNSARGDAAAGGVRLAALHEINADCAAVTRSCVVAGVLAAPAVRTWARTAGGELAVAARALESRARLRRVTAPTLVPAAVELPLAVECLLTVVPRVPALLDLVARVRVAQRSAATVVSVWNRRVAGARLPMTAAGHEIRPCLAKLLDELRALPGDAEELVRGLREESLALGELARERLAAEHLA